MDEKMQRIANLSPLKRSLLALEEMQVKLRALEQAKTEPIAIIGMGCHFPGGVHNPEAFWQKLYSGYDAVTEIPSARWNWHDFYDPQPGTAGKMYTRWGGFLEDVDTFDAQFFGISPREATSMDPQQRLLLQTTWEALENAGLPPDELIGSKTGVFIGISNEEYTSSRTKDLKRIDPYVGTGGCFSVAAGRISYVFGLQGPNLSMDTACSSSLVAVHLACQSLRQGESDLALVGGVNLILSPRGMVYFCAIGALAPDGRCKTFDARADGYTRGEGCGIVVLKRLSDAIANNDTILALIRGSAINHDGRSSGLMAPNGIAQQTVIRKALNDAKIGSSHVDYIEAHGTGTSLGDPIEIGALSEVFSENRPVERPLRIGSVKTNIGHLEAAAGISGLIKVVLSLQHKEIPPHLHLTQVSPLLSLEKIPAIIPTEATPWTSYGEPRRAGVSSFGFSGTNAHIILEEAPLARDSDESFEDSRPTQAHIFVFSARAPEALNELTSTYQDFMAEQESIDSSLSDICYTASRRRAHHKYRASVVAYSHREVIERLQTMREALEQPALPDKWSPGINQSQKVVFVFSGQGSQWVGMATQLIEQEPIFRAALVHCEEVMRTYVPWSLMAELTADPAHTRIDETEIAQPAIFAIQVALATLWRSWGIELEAVIGHSMGEVAATHVAGALSLEDAAMIICRRSHLLMQVSGQGAMAMVELSLDQARQVVKEYEPQVSIAVSNSPRSTVLSGDRILLQHILEHLQRQGIFCRWVRVDYASHSLQMDQIKPLLQAELRGIHPLTTSVPIYSTVTGTPVNGSILDSKYWMRNLREPVLFMASVQRALQDGYNCFLEISPHPILVPALKECCLATAPMATVLGSVRRDREERSALLETLSTFYNLGHAINWPALYPTGKQVVFPSYPWQLTRFWFDDDDKEEQSAVESKGFQVPALENDVQLSSKDIIDDWLYVLQWEAAPLPASPHRPTTGGYWLIFTDNGSVGTKLGTYLEKQGYTCIFVSIGDDYQKDTDAHYCLNPLLPEAFTNLCQDISRTNKHTCCGIVHLWSLDALSTEQTTLSSLEQAQDRGCISVLHLVQALSQAGWRDLPRLWLITRGVHAVDGTEETISIAQAPLWGLGRTIGLEHPSLQCSLFDLSMQADDDELLMLCQELIVNDIENQLAIRRATRYVARLERQSASLSANVTDDTFIKTSPDTAYRLEVRKPGLLESLTLCAYRPGAPAVGEVQIRVHLTSLNFRDVLKALDLYPTVEEKAHDFLLGDECVGTVVALGEGVTRWQIGQPVVALAAGCLGSLVNVSEARVFAQPSNLSDEEAVSVPVAYLTASYALRHLARLQAGERVLIHAAAGGVGLAAVALAQVQGAEIFATAGSPSKRAYLQHLGIAADHLFDSRSLVFVEQIRRCTQGAGVDVVLNSLTGEAMVQSLALLAPAGRFIEIGKRDIYQNHLLGLWPFHRNLSYMAVDLAWLAQDCPSLLRELAEKVFDELATGRLPPLPTRVFALEQAQEAFRYLAQAKQIGKVVLAMPRQGQVLVLPPTFTTLPQRANPIGGQGTYVVTGGLGGLGWQVAHWLIERGARWIVLLGRQANRPVEAVHQQVEQWQEQGVKVRLAAADVADADDLRQVWSDLQHEQWPSIRGVIHAAGVLDDGILLQQRRERFIQVMRSKIAGGWNLHVLTREQPLDFLVLFSSATSLIGSPGQSNYATANAFLDALAHYRGSQGMVGQSINWGPWTQVGLVSRKEREQRLAFRGISSLQPAQGIAALERVLERGERQIAVMNFNMRQWGQYFPKVVRSPVFARLQGRAWAEGRDKEKRSAVRQAVEKAAVAEGEQVLEQHVREQLGQVLQIVPARLEGETPLQALGVDSLMAMELRNRLEASLGVELSATIAWNYPTVGALSHYLYEQIMNKQPGESEAEQQEAAQPLERLTKEELNLLLAQELSSLEQTYVVNNQTTMTASQLRELSEHEAESLLFETLLELDREK